MLTFRMDFKSRNCKISNVEGTRFPTMPQIGMIGMPQVRVGVVGHAMQLMGNHTHFRAIQE